MKIISGSAHPALARKIAAAGRFKLVPVEISEFKNGERRVRIKGKLAGQPVAIIQTLSAPPDRHLIELLLLIDAARRLHPKNLSVVIPWLGYSLQDKVFRAGEPISAKVVAKVISESGADDVLVMDLHQESIVGFFDIPVKHLSAVSLFTKKYKRNKRRVVVSPDFGGAKRARELARLIGAPMALISKERARDTGDLKINGMSRSVRGANCLIFDDVVLSGNTIKEAGQILKNSGAKSVSLCATHGLFLDGAWDNLARAGLGKIYVTDTVPISKPTRKLDFGILATAHLFARALKEINGK